LLALVGLNALSAVKGAVEDIIAQVVSKRVASDKAQVQWFVPDHTFFAPGSSQRVELNGELHRILATKFGCHPAFFRQLGHVISSSGGCASESSSSVQPAKPAL